MVSSTPRAQDGCTFDLELQSSQSIEGDSLWFAHTSYEVRDQLNSSAGPPIS